MPKKRRKKSKPKKITAKTFTMQARESSGDLVKIQIHARLKRVPKGMKITKKLLESMVRRKAELSGGQWDGGMRMTVGAHEGPNPKGIELEIVRWSNPSRKGTLGNWRAAYSQADAWGSLRRVLRRIRL